jgi:thymidylate kinase
LIIEWVGCSGTGKSTLLEAVYRQMQSSSIDARKPLEVFLGSTIAKTISNERLQNIALDFLVLPWSIFSFFKYRRFVNFCRKILSDGHFSFSQKAKLFRSILRKTGLHIFLSSLSDKKKPILIDEGTVHIAHLLFANGDNNKISPQNIEKFCELVPTPGLIIHIMAPESDALERTLNRRDKPISDTSPEAIKRFIKLGHETFKILNDLAPWENKTITLANPNISLKSNEETALDVAKQITDYLSSAK